MKTIYSKSRALLLLAVLPILFIALFVVVPTLNIFFTSIQLDSLKLLRTSQIRNIVLFTTWQAIASTVIALIVALPIAFCMANFRFTFQRLSASLISLPFVLPSIVVGVAFLQILPSNLHRTAFALILAHVYFNFGFAARLIGARWLQIHPHLDDAARTLGASPFKLLTTITLPLLRRSIINAALIVFTLCFTSYGVVRILGGPSRSTLETEIYFRAMQLGDVSGAMLLGALQIMIIGALFIATIRANRGSGEQTSRPSISRQKPLRATKQKLAIMLVILSAALFAVAPVAAIAIRSLTSNSKFTTEAWQTVFANPEIIQSLGKTLIFAMITMTLAPFLGLICACNTIYG
ncbi:iron ABC transporter permease, partial [bacterium]|nr:iron ABC transporter permease [bacterium]